MRHFSPALSVVTGASGVVDTYEPFVVANPVWNGVTNLNFKPYNCPTGASGTQSNVCFQTGERTGATNNAGFHINSNSATCGAGLVSGTAFDTCLFRGRAGAWTGPAGTDFYTDTGYICGGSTCSALTSTLSGVYDSGVRVMSSVSCTGATCSLSNGALSIAVGPALNAQNFFSNGFATFNFKVNTTDPLVSGNQVFVVSGIANSVNGIAIIPSVAGVSPVIRPVGEANLDMRVDAIGTGRLRTATPFVTQSYVRVGSLLAPTNINAGDFTADRIFQGASQLQVLDTLTAGSGITITGSGNSRTISATGGGGVTSIAGTAGQITASASTGAVTLSLPTFPYRSVTSFASSILFFVGACGSTGASLTVTGAPESFKLTLVAGSGACSASSAAFQFSWTWSGASDVVCTMTPQTATAVGVVMGVDANASAFVGRVGTVALTASTTYVWNVMCMGTV